ncbi:O-antigen ligase family protein [Candidatus Vallotia cooleyia]|uniref:O-antigen ligase family protein n=1 Tax=Candidatus Vallotiella adelgis TaxID=1177211 RepID=UPI001D01C03E|nr:O-antigen ligase family protein [Candidatus Vallotia cooleyia]UDG82436.1 O-Antigen ligase [Candidatus Vallotia cooleyia]
MSRSGGYKRISIGKTFVLMYLNQFVTGVTTAAIILSPTLILSVKGGTGYCFFTILALAFLHLAILENRRHAIEILRTYRLYAISMSTLPVVIAFQVLVLHDGRLAALDPMLRLVLVIPSFLLLASLPSYWLCRVEWGFVAGALLTGAWALYAIVHPSAWYGPGRLGNSFINPIPFGDMALLIGFLAFASLDRGNHVSGIELAIKIIALLAGCLASYLSGSRGGWIALPWLIWSYFSGRHWMLSIYSRIAVGAVLVGCLTIAGTTSIVSERLNAISTDLRKFEQGEVMTSTGQRLELWRASLRLLVEHPVLGVGKGHLKLALIELADRGKISRLITNEHAHNEFFSMLAEVGIIGMMSLILLYIGTFLSFWRERKNEDTTISTAAYLGLALVGSTMIFGLTIDILPIVMNSAFFALTSATLLATIASRKRELTQK